MINKIHNALLALALISGIILAAPVALNTYIPFYIVESGSMLPTYRVGSIVLVHHYMPRHLHELTGRVIVFYDPAGGRVMVHRAVAVDGKYIVTKGDNNPGPDRFKPTAKDVLGIVWANVL